MLYVPRHFFVNNHIGIEEVLGADAYAEILYKAGYKSAWHWCEKEAECHGLEGVAVDVDLADLCVLATPHIAGYSLEGRQRGTAQIYQAFCGHLGQEPSIQLSDLLPPLWLAEVHLNAETDPAWALATLCRSVYDPRRDDADFRRSLVGTSDEQRGGQGAPLA